jgi:multiple sugar transport system ATP-binding protein
MAKLELQNIHKSFGSTDIIKGIDLSIKHGEFVVFVGPSGCGKSTLLRMIAGLETISQGTIIIGDKVVNDLPPKDRSIAMVFQSYALFPHMTVRDNVGFGLKIAGLPKTEVAAKVAEASRMLKLDELLDRKPSQLSGGQRQRVAIGRAIVRNPDVFLFDEPLSNLDAALRVNTRAEIAKLHRDLGATMVYVTHDQIEAMTLADRIVVLDAGRVRQFGTPLELYHMPQNLFVAGFIGSPKMNFLEVEAVKVTTTGVVVRSDEFAQELVPVTAARVKAGDKLTLGIRPEHMMTGAKGEFRISGEVELVEHLGHETFVEAKSRGGTTFNGLIDGETLVKHGQHIAISFNAADCHLFTSDGEALTRLNAPKIAGYKKG